MNAPGGVYALNGVTYVSGSGTSATFDRKSIYELLVATDGWWLGTTPEIGFNTLANAKRDSTNLALGISAVHQRQKRQYERSAQDRGCTMEIQEKPSDDIAACVVTFPKNGAFSMDYREY